MIMKMRKKVSALAATITMIGSLAGGANGAVTITFSAEGDNTRTTITGSINTTGLTFSSPIGGAGSFGMSNNRDLQITKAPGRWIHADHGLTLPTWHSIDEAQTIDADDITGRDFGIEGTKIFLPESYTSESEINTDFRILRKLSEIDPQSGVILTLGNGDTVSVLVVPEPSSSLLLGLGGIAVLLRRVRRGIS